MWWNGTVVETRIEVLAEADRTALCQMLAESEDFPDNLLGLYRRGRNGDLTLVSWRDDEIDAVLTGSFNSDLTGIADFDSFDPPRGRHAFIDRLHVRNSSRRMGVGSALIESFADEAAVRGCSFIGGSIDQSSDSRQRLAFFERLGFGINELLRIGAQPSDILFGQ